MMSERISIYISAGFATAPNFLQAFAEELATSLEQAGWTSQIIVHFPYGDWSIKRRVQLREIGSDLWCALRQRSSVHGGKGLFEIIEQTSQAEDRLLLIGHSGGAVASVHAAEQLQNLSRLLVGVVQIGSPKTAIPASLKEKVLYLKAVSPTGKQIDPIPLVGTWGGWERAGWGWWRWNRLKTAPDHREVVSIVGGHADYFRNHEPYVFNGSTNLSSTMSALWTFLQNALSQIKIPIEKEDEHD
ncbi:hypothetical protein GK047_11390 [Paenibacillus sp. SYP-B3998]|uniref:Alpha/beta hydrolase n=1 Tax=Paenibacillus sp. SYP-B3998 TaxID=2678564 RepID=A0A6G3ZYY7_9BACL|nr:hypothetical protein [Paenibacillus sp. SYP-B3998]NEW06617.1 hypothetical protein [Paenibacillus sp. SYP-B3998]